MVLSPFVMTDQGGKERAQILHLFCMWGWGGRRLKGFEGAYRGVLFIVYAT